MKILIISLTLVSLTLGQDDFDFVGSAFKFQCPEPNGLFADPEQCDLYYVCEDNIASPELCEDGLLFDDSRRNKERCVLPHGVDCGKRYRTKQMGVIHNQRGQIFGIFDPLTPPSWSFLNTKIRLMS